MPNALKPIRRNPFRSAIWRIGALIAVLSTAQSFAAVEIYVSPTGDDSNLGTSTSPLRTLHEARDRVRAMQKVEPITVVVESGTHYLETPLVLGAEDSGSADADVVWRAASEGDVILSGGLRINGTWTSAGNGVWQMPTPAGLQLDQLFIDGRRKPMARYPNETNNSTDAWNGYAADAFSTTKAAGWSNPSGGFMHAMHEYLWGGYHYRILGKNADGSLNYEGGWQNNRPSGMHPQFRMVENIREELDTPGEWFHDRATNTLFYIPQPGTDPNTVTVEGVRLASLIEVRGNAAQPVKHVRFEGFVFRHTARTFMDTQEPLLRSDWTIYRGGSVFLTGSEDVTISDCDFDQVGGNAVFISNYNRRAMIRGCHIHDCGASGVAFVGDPDAVFNPLFQYDQTQDLLATDTASGPKTPNYPSDSTVEDCLIHGVGKIERQTAAVQISMSSRITVRDVSVYDCSRAGINISEGTWGGHLLEGLDVFDTVLETSDHGSFNSWGRDRFWTANRSTTDSAVAQRPTLPFLDACETTVIRNSRWRCDHGWDIDLDDGSTNYDIYNNLLLNGGLKFREGYRRRAWNNVFVNSGFHPHVWYQNSGDSFERNVIMRGPSPIGMPSGWESAMSSNFLASLDAIPTVLDASIGGVNSQAGRAGFLDPTTGDYQVAADSRAITLGFQNFPMDQFGVKKPALRAIARTPVLPVPSYTAVNPLAAPYYWRGAELLDLQPGQFSAFGTREEDGGVAIAQIAPGSSADLAGLLANDLIQGLNGQVVRNLQDFSKALAETTGTDMIVAYVRNQQPLAQLNAGQESVRWKWQPGATFLPASPAALPTCEASPNTTNDPISVLTDNALAATYGPVFSNGVARGYYRLHLPQNRSSATLELWSYHLASVRGHFKVNIFDASGETDPGWQTEGGAFRPVASMITGGMQAQQYNRLALAIDGTEPFRWLLIETIPLNSTQEHTAFQEIRVLPGVGHMNWDSSSNTGMQGGNGSWNTAATNWTDDNGTTRTAWNNLANERSQALFGSSGGTVTLSETIRLGGIQTVGNVNGYELVGGSLDFGTARGWIDTTTLETTGGSIFTIASPLVGSHGIDIAANGNLSGNGGSSAGLLTLSGDNTALDGGIAIIAGLVQPASPSSLGSGTVTLDNAAGLVTGWSDLTVDNPIVLSDGGGTFRAYYDHTLTCNGVLSGTGPLSKTDSGTLVLTAANTYTGETRVLDGALFLTNPCIANTSTVRIGATGKLRLEHTKSDRIAKLFINDVQQPSGTYHAGNTSAIIGTGSLLVAPPTGYDQWLVSYGLSEGSPYSSPLESADLSGVENLLQYALGGDPTDPANNGIVRPALAEINGQANRLVLTVAVKQGADFAGSPLPTATVGDLTYRVEGTADFTQWTSAVEEVPAQDDGGNITPLAGYVLKSFVLSESPPSQAAGFIRVRVTQL